MIKLNLLNNAATRITPRKYIKLTLLVYCWLLTNYLLVHHKVLSSYIFNQTSDYLIISDVSIPLCIAVTFLFVAFYASHTSNQSLVKPVPVAVTSLVMTASIIISSLCLDNPDCLWLAVLAIMAYACGHAVMGMVVLYSLKDFTTSELGLLFLGSFIVLLPTFLALYHSPSWLALAVALVLPIGIALLSKNNYSSAQSYEIASDSENPPYTSKTLVCAMLLIGFYSTYSSSLFIATNNINYTLSFVSGLLSAGLICYIALLKKPIDFRKMLFLIAVPCMCLSTPFCIMHTPISYLAGNFFCSFGTWLSTITIIILMVRLSKLSPQAPLYIFVLVLAFYFIGSFTGTLLFHLHNNIFDLSVNSRKSVSSMIDFLIMFACIILYNKEARIFSCSLGSDGLQSNQDTLKPIESCCAQLGEQAGLTERETEVFTLLAHGNNRKAVAEFMFISENTVKTHTKSIYKKLNIHSRQELINLVEESRIIL